MNMIATSAKKTFQKLFVEAEKLGKQVALHHIEASIAELAKSSLSDTREDEFREWLMEKDDELVKPFANLTLSLYQTMICYLDAMNMHAYLGEFYKAFGKKFDKSKAAEQYDVDHFWTGEPSMTFLDDLRRFARPLGLMDESDMYLKLSGVSYLETILKRTAVIINKQKLTPKSEPEVYKAVKSTLECIFPSAKKASANFLKHAQEYKPDVLIPELSSVVEYKYANDEQKLKSCIAQIADDVKGYSGDSDYSLFYAVFYVTDDFWGNDKFKLAWKEKEFPQNWRGIYVVGRGT